MAVFSERVQIFVDFIEGKGGAGKGAFATALNDIKQAEGGLGKLKAAGSNVGNILGSIGWSGVAAGAGVLAAGVMKATDAFSKLALESKKFGEATGLATEDASRWIEVAGDVGVATGTLETAFAKLNSTIQSDPDKLKKWGADVALAKDGTVDLQATILNVVGALNQLDPSSRAAAMKELFGKGAVGAAELFNMSVEDIKKNLDDVSEAKVIDKEEEAKALKLREATDNLKDVWENIVLIVGEWGAGLADGIGFIGKAIEKTEELKDKSGHLGDWLTMPSWEFLNVPKQLEKIWGDSKDEAEDAAASIDNVAASSVAAGDAALNAGGSGIEAWGRMNDAAQDAAGAIHEVGFAYDELMGKLDAQEAALNLADDFDKVHSTAQDAFAAAASGAEDAEGKGRDAQRAVIDLKRSVADYATQVADLPEEQVTELLTMIDQGEFDRVEKRIAFLSRDRTVGFTFKYSGVTIGPPTGPGTRTAPTSAMLAAAPPPAAGVAPMAAPDLVIPVRAAQPLVQVILPTGSVPTDVVGAIQRWTGRNGSLRNAGIR